MPRLVIRRFRAADVPAFASYRSDPEVARFTLDPQYQGHGYATEAVQAMLRHLFTDRKLRRISAECDARNVSSARLLERTGFRREGLRRQHTWIKGEWTDDLLFGLLAAEFPAEAAA